MQGRENVDACIKAIYHKKSFVQSTSVIPSDDHFGLVLDKTSFYAESGGQEYDTGSITIDGKSTDVDGARPELRPYECFSLFSTTGLDPNVEHTVNMTIKGPSPNRDISVPAATIFSLVNYTSVSF